MINIAHIHPMLIHFPLALLPVAIGTQLLALFRGEDLFNRSCLSSTAVSLLVLAAAGAVVAAVFGDMALDKALDAGVQMATMEDHEELGKISAVLLSLLAVAALWFYRRAGSSITTDRIFLFASLVVLAVLIATAWFGGQLVYEHGVNVLVSPH
jgi:uncharacterized membrane protein